jgi:glycosyltransferase involved in cell wall biosynthesis
VSVPDLNFKAFGSLMPFSRRLMLSMFIKQAVIHSNKVITISEFSRQEILREYRVSQEKVVVTHLAAEIGSLKEKSEDRRGDTIELPDIRQPYIVAFSSSYPNKNISRLIEAFIELRKKNRLEQKLVLIGHKYLVGKDKLTSELLEENKDIIWTGYLDRQLVFRILERADFLVFPSFYEGFGLPILEAMAVGVPVVCSKAASLPEVAGDAAIFFDPFSVNDIAEKIVSIAGDSKLRDNLRQKGFKNLECFSWKKTAAETVAVYNDLLINK